MYNGGWAFECTFLSEKQAMIVLRSQVNLIIHGQISNFVNPHSIKSISNIECQLFTRRDKLKVVSTNLGLYSFTAADIGVDLSSSSNVYGDQNVVLNIKLTPYTAIPAVGYLVMDIPKYYEGAGQDFMFMQSEIDPCELTSGYVTECLFNQRLQQLSIKYAFHSQEESKEQITFSIGMFKNPVSRNKDGFLLEILDENQYQVSKTRLTKQLTGIDSPAKFKSWDFNYVDTAASGQYATHQFILESSIPLQLGCRVKIFYPKALTVSDRLTSLSGTGFFQPRTGQLTFTINTEENSVELVACDQNYGQVTFGILSLTQILNQPYVDDTESFKIYMTQEIDEQFSNSYIQLENNFIIPESQQRPGAMKGTIAATSTLVQTFTNLKIEMTPSLDLNTTSYVIINIPRSLEFQGPSCTVSEQTGFSEFISCSRFGHQITISNPFDGPYKAGVSDKLSMTLEEFLMPTAVQRIGTIEVITYDIRAGEFRPIDQLDLTELSSVSGPIMKMSEVTVGTSITGLTDQTYIFHYKLTHSVPLNGFFSFLLSEDDSTGVMISNHETAQKSCFLVTPTGDKGLECVTGQNDAGRFFVNVTCSQAGFGPKGTLKGQEFKFKLGGLTNPRTRNLKNYFKLYSMDSYYRYIDQNFEDQQFWIMMTDLKQITSVSVDAISKVNGEYTDYIVSIVPSTQLFSDDQFQIKFPPQIELPIQMNCSSPTIKYIYDVSCIKDASQMVFITLDRVSKLLFAGVEIQLAVHQVRNSPSLRPSDAFTDMLFVNAENGKELTQFSQDIFVQNVNLGQIQKETAKIVQSSYQALEESQIGITFYTNNELPQSATILLAAPSTVTPVPNYDKCFIKLRGVKQESVCTFDGSYIIYKGAFTDLATKFTGKIELFFLSLNPKDNQEISKFPYKINIYDDADMKYGIDELDEAIYPILGCSYPCQECLQSNPDYCTACIPKKVTPQYLHGDIFAQTCVDFCPPGFTNNGTVFPKKCLGCADTCETCRQADEPNDINICLTCKEEFPFYWVEEYSCHSNECPPGSYESVTNTCRTCNETCQLCSDRLTCTKCNAYSDKPYLFQGQCLEQCVFGYTPIDNICVKCSPPCATCDFGQINSCLSCDNTGTKQFLYGKKCLEECPVNTTLDFDSKMCLGCQTGCAFCDDQDNTICLKCSPGLALLENECLEECPFDFLKSEDGSVCERRTYPLDKTFVAFPILGTAAFFTLIIYASHKLTSRRSLFVSSLIAFYGPIEMAGCFYQFLYASQEDKEYKPILIGSICAFTAGMIVNVVFVVNYRKQIKGTDAQFERWCQDHKISSNFFLIIAGGCCLTLYRLIYSRLFRFECMTVDLNKPQPFLKPIFIFTGIRYIVFNFPLIIVDLVGTQYLAWGNQCYMTMVETLILSLTSLGLQIYEYVHREELILREDHIPNLNEVDLKQAKHYRFVHPMAEEEDYTHINIGACPFQDRLALNQIKTIIPGVQMPERVPLTSRALRRNLESFAQVIHTVKTNQGCQLNGDLDIILDLETEQKKQALRRCKSMVILTKTRDILLDGDDIRSEKLSEAGFGIDEHDKLKEIHQYIIEYQMAKLLADKDNQYSDPESDNVYAEAQDPPEDTPVLDTEMQTDMNLDQDGTKMQAERMKDQIRDGMLDALMQKRREQQEKKNKRKKQFRRGKKSFYENQIDEEDSDDSEKSDKYAQNLVPTAIDQKPKDILTVAMQVEKNQSLTSLWDLNVSEQERIQDMVEKLGAGSQNLSQEPLLDPLALQSNQVKGISLSRVSGDLDFTESEDNDRSLEKDPLAKDAAEKLKIENVKAWIQDSSDAVNIRNFNINDIIGNFEKDWSGMIDEREFTLERAGYIDRDGNVVNIRGYLVDEYTGDLRSRYSFEVMFKSYQLIGPSNAPCIEIPVPFRIEKYNFNPHQCLGNFDYDENDKHIPLRDKEGFLIDKNLRKVNKSGWLIDDEENIIDNKGNVKFIRAQLNDRGELPKLLNYEGEEYRIKSIMGIFERNKHSKEIILCAGKQGKYVSSDLLGRKVNSRGYLLDDRGNIINRQGNIIWPSHQLFYNEPPKLFSFSEFSINWIKGHLDRDVTQNPRHDDEYDLDGKRINTMGYLIDHKENIIDCFRGNIVFKREVLEARYGQEAEIPWVFRSGKLRQPPIEDDIERELELKHQIARKKGARQRPGMILDGIDEDSDFEDDEIIQDLKAMGNKGRDNIFGQLKNGNLASIRDNLGRVIQSIPQSTENALLRDVSEQQLSGKSESASSPTKPPLNYRKRGSILKNPRNQIFLSRPQTGHPGGQGGMLGASHSMSHFSQQNPTPQNKLNVVGFQLDSEESAKQMNRAQSAMRSPHNMNNIKNQNFFRQ